MAARKRRGTAPRKSDARSSTRASQTRVLDAVQQVWLAGMGAIAKAQREGPAAFQDAVVDGLKLLGRSRSSAEKMLRDAFDTAHGSMQGRLDVARDQASETWDNLESLFQTRVQKALKQIGVPTADEVRDLAKHVTELNDLVREFVQQSGDSGRRSARVAKAGKPATRRRRKRAG